jgi:hypothetical protein
MDDTSMYSQLDPALLAKLGVIPDQQAALDHRMALAQGLMNTPTPEGTKAGGTFVAANPLQFLSSALRQGIGGYQNHQLMGQKDDLTNQQAGGREAYIRALVNQLRGGQQQPTQPTGMPPGLINSSYT